MEDEKKTKKQLIEELKELRLRSAAPEKVAFPDSKHLEKEMQKHLHKLAERVKELDCLYGISNLIETPDISTEGILRGTVELLSRAWQYPDLTCARIVLKDQTYETANFQESPWRLTSNIRVQGEPTGMVEVFYLTEPSTDGQAPFLPEEVNLLNAVAESLGRVTDRKQAEMDLEAREKELENRTAELEEANTALRVILRRREEDQKIIEEKIQANVNELIMPLVRKLRQTYLNGQSANVVNLLEANIGNIIAPFINHLSTAHKTMTPKEIQVAALIRQGNKSKEIASIIGVSIGTVNTHRDNIRKKLNLKSKDVNLHAHLLSLA